jgi:hypothetical protein
MSGPPTGVCVEVLKTTLRLARRCGILRTAVRKTLYFLGKGDSYG